MTWIKRQLEPALSAGFDPRLPTQTTKRVRLGNGIALLCVAIGVVSIPYDLVAAPWWMPFEDIASIVLFSCVPLLARSGRRTAARALILVLGNAIMLGNAMLMGRSAGAHFVLFAMLMLPFVLFEEHERRPIAIGAGFPALAFTWLSIDGFAFAAEHLPHFEFPGYYGYSAALTFTVMVVTLRHLARSNARAESALRASEEHYRLITETARDAIITVDRDDRIVFASPSALAMFGHRGPDLIGHALDELLPFDRGTALPSDRERLVAGLRDGRRHDGSQFACEVTIGTSTPPTLIRTLIIRDASDRVRNQRLLDEARAQSLFSAKLAALGEMSSGIAHEINNPLTALDLAADQLRRRCAAGRVEPAEIGATAERIQRIIGRISKIVSALHFFARDARRDPMARVSVRQLVNDTLELCGERFRQHNIDLRVSPFPDELAVDCSGVQISQVLLNLLANAHDAVEGRDPAWVALGVEARGEDLVLTVTDSNPGVPEDVRDKIFQPFFTTKGVGKGTGLGLSVSHGIIETHRGRLELDTSSPHTCFVVRLPLRQATSPPA